jgi:ribosome maturation factor RimP
MIEKKKIEKLVNEVVSDDFFIVKIAVSTSNKIQVYIDSIKGASIDDCIKLSRYIENNLDREEEDFELEVSTPSSI